MNPTFQRILIINRGEPAMRLIRAVRELRAETGWPLRAIALYTDPDKRSLFVREADEAIRLGPALSEHPRDGRLVSTYLDYRRLEACLRESAADAAWVGWGFVAEHAEFAELCDRLGVVFIGPPAGVMRRLGDKIAAKKLAEEADVPVARWSGGAVETLDEARACADRLGFPLMLKASAGGGGRGIRRVGSGAELAEAFQRSRAEALKAFGDDRVFLEEQLAQSRHVEVQIVADAHGATWAAGVRDCSLQRRNQKILEEAPSPVLSDSAREALCQASVRLAAAAGYRNAGTVEFLFDPAKGAFWFMEMNTRLQVEHPVTEATTGLDIVKLQLDIAAGRPLAAEPPPTTGHSIEVRLCAEDPDRGFAPSPGHLAQLRLPTGPGVRVDAGVSEGDDVAPEFDSMIAKIIAHGRTRDEAMARLARALSEAGAVIEGGATNRAFLLELLAHPEVRAGGFDIGWLDRYAASRAGAQRAHADIAVLQAAVEVHVAEHWEERAELLRSAARGRPAVQPGIGRKVELRYGSQAFACRVLQLGHERYRVDIGERRFDLRVDRLNRYERWVTCRGRRVHVWVQQSGGDFRFEIDGVAHRVSRDDGGLVRAPAPALVLAVDVVEGQRVAAGERVAVLEAMKMEMAVLAPSAGRVRQVLVRPSTNVGVGAPLVVLEPELGVAATEAAPTATVSFEGEDSTPTNGWARARQNLDDLLAFVRGFDVHPQDALALSRELDEAWSDPDAAHAVLGAIEEDLLRVFTDLFRLCDRRPQHWEDTRHSSADYLATFLHGLHGAARKLPAAFTQRLERALAHHLVSPEARGWRLDEALFRVYCADARAAALVQPMLGILERRLTHADRLRPRTSRTLQGLLHDLVEVTQDRFAVLNDLARQVRYRYFEKPLLERAQAEVYQELEASMLALIADPDGPQRGARVEAIVDCPHPVVGFLTRWMDADEPGIRRLVLELQVRRFYTAHEPTALHTQELDGVTLVTADLTIGGEHRHLVAALSRYGELPRALGAMARVTSGLETRRPVLWDFFTPYPGDDAAGGSRADALRERLEALVREVELVPRPEHVSFCLIAGRNRADHYFTFDLAGERPEEVRQLRGMHPMWAERLDLWRLGQFDLEPLEAPEDIYLYRAQAQQNPADMRLVALVDVRDLTAVSEGSDGSEPSLPQLERMLLETLDAMRVYQYRLPPHKRLHWNRIFLYLWRPLPVAPEALVRLVDRLAPAARNLGLEKVVVRTRLPAEPGGALEARELHIGFHDDRVGRVRIDPPSAFEMRTLSPYQQRVVRLRARGLVYPYEIVRLLTPRQPHGAFARGRFIEYDLDESGELAAVDRSYGENTANLVVGIIESYTAKVPEGMRRVVLLGDPSREMGALAEPECMRIVKAFDLAESEGIPVEWFPLSAGAKISMDSGTENLDWTAAVLRRIIEFTQRGGTANVVVAGVNVGAQSYWNAEATMLMHTRGILIMTPDAAMVLTGKGALDYSGSVSAEDNVGIGGVDRIMGPNGQAQVVARDLPDACRLLLRHYEHTYVVPGERFPRRAQTADPIDRDVSTSTHRDGDEGFRSIGEVFSPESNPSRKRAFDVRSVMHAVVDQDLPPLERWGVMREAETAVVWEAHVGGIPACLIGMESRPIPRFGLAPSDGPESWTAGTLFPLSSKKVARALNAASGNRPAVILANLSGFDGSPESLRRLQLEYGAEIGRAVVNFDGPLVFCVISRYHGGAYVVFSKRLNENLEAAALEGSYASVIGGAPAAAIVLVKTVDERVYADADVQRLQRELRAASGAAVRRLRAELDETVARVRSQKLAEVAEEFDATHSVARAQRVGSIDNILPPSRLRPYLVEALERGMAKFEARLLEGRPTNGQGHVTPEWR